MKNLFKKYINDNRKRDYFIELVLVFILGFLVGIFLKIEAGKLVTIGFDDYKMKFSKNQYSINDLQKKVNEDLAAQEENSGEQGEQENSQDNLQEELQ